MAEIQLTPEDIEALKAHMEKHCKNYACSSCGNNHWEATGIVAAMAIVNGAFHLGGSVTPTVILVCSTCGYMRHFSWLKIRPGWGGGGNV